MTDDLKARIAAAIRAAAYDCDGNCGKPEAECDADHPIQVAALHYDVIASVYGDIGPLADAVLTVVQPIADELAFTSTDRLKLATMDRDSWQRLADLTQQRAQKAEAERDKLKAEFTRIQTLLDGDDLPLLCPDCVCEDCGGRLGQHTPGGDCSCGCNPPCDRFLEDPKLDLIAEAARPMTGSPLSEAVAHATWHALTQAETAERSDR